MKHLSIKKKKIKRDFVVAASEGKIVILVNKSRRG